MFDIMTEGIVVIDSDHNLLAANNAFRSIFGPDIPEIHSSENPVPYEVLLPDGSPLPRNGVALPPRAARRFCHQP